MKYILGVSGTPGAGKSTFCQAIKTNYETLHRRVKIFNLDAGCEHFLAYAADWNITTVIKISEIMKTSNSGFNGALIEGMKTFFEEHIEILMEKIKESEDDTLIILDLPGQVELFTVRDSVKNFYSYLLNSGQLRVCNIYMFEASILHNLYAFVAYATNVTMSMLHLAVPQLNLVSKIDIMYHAKNSEKLSAPVGDYSNLLTVDPYESCLTGNRVERLNSTTFMNRLIRLNQNYSLLNLFPFTSSDANFVALLRFQIDRALGWLNPRVSVNTVVADTSNDERRLMDYTEVFLEKCVKRNRSLK